MGLEGGCSRPRGRGPEAGTLALDLFEKEEEIIIQLLVNSLLQPWNRMPEEETEGTRHAPRLVKAVPLFLPTLVFSESRPEGLWKRALANKS